MFIDSKFPESLGLQKMKNDYILFLLFYHVWFHVIELMTFVAGAGNGFYWNEVQGATNTQIFT